MLGASGRKQRPGTFGINLLKLRRERGWSQRQLAEVSGVGRVTIANLERGAHKSPDAATLERLAGALGVPPGALWETPETPAADGDAVAGLGAFLERYRDELTGHECRILEGLRGRAAFAAAADEDWWELVRLVRQEFLPKLGRR